MEEHYSIYTGMDSRIVLAFWFLNHGKLCLNWPSVLDSEHESHHASCVPAGIVLVGEGRRMTVRGHVLSMPRFAISHGRSDF
jgi:hypothetical protein